MLHENDYVMAKELMFTLDSLFICTQVSHLQFPVDNYPDIVHKNTYSIKLAALPLDRSLYLALCARPWLRISQSYDDDERCWQRSCCLLQRQPAPGPTLGSELAGTMLCGLQLLLSSVSHARQLTFAPRTPTPLRKQLSRTSALARVGYGGV